MKFNVGDRVMMVSPMFETQIGALGTVSEVRERYDSKYVYPYLVVIDGDPTKCPVNENEIELWVPTEYPTASVASYPDNNPKTLVGASKIPLHLVPPSAKYYLAQALKNGADKYGAYNWRDAAISVSTYKAAMERHMDAFWDGEDFAEDSGVHHVAHAMACAALILDALSIDKLVDDRPTKGASSRLQQEYLS